MDLTKVAYIDNNAGTLVPDVVKQAMLKWINTGNLSAPYADAVGTKQLLNNLKATLARACVFDLEKYTIVITSGASESNNFILRSATKSYRRSLKRVPHILISAVEHKSVLACIEDMLLDNMVEVTFVPPDASGQITWEAVRLRIQTNTALVCVMDANNEVGTINEITNIGRALASRVTPIPFYVDCVQTMGKFPIKPEQRCITAFGGSFHKLGGPQGIGVLVATNAFLSGYNISAEICGTQNNGLRGGTESLMNIAGALTAINEAHKQREKKNRTLMALQLYTLKALAAKIPTSFFETWEEAELKAVSGSPNYKESGSPPKIEMVVMGPSEMNPEKRCKLVLPNTLMVSFITHIEGKTGFVCNRTLEGELRKNNVIVGLGSACNTGNTSHVLDAIKAPPPIPNGAIRISFGDANTNEHATILVREIQLALDRITKLGRK